LPGANGRNPYLSGEQLVRLAQVAVGTNALGEYHG
jgi:hypothetical protein